MRQALGVAVLMIGLGGLGIWGTADHARKIEREVAQGAASVVAVTTHGMQVQVRGRDLLVTGIANDPAERDRILAALDIVPGRRVVRDGLTVLPQRDPYLFQASRAADGAVTLMGHVPSESVRATLAEAVGTQATAALELAAGAPDAGWSRVARQGLEALSLMNFGELSMQGRTVSLTGQVQNPGAEALVRAPLATLPEGYTAEVLLDLLDDGQPFALELMAEDGIATWRGGKLPLSLGTEALDEAFGAIIEGDLVFAQIGAEDTDWAGVAQVSVQALATLRSGTLSIADRSVALEGLAPLPTDAAVVEAALGALPEGFEVRLELDIEDDGAPYALELTKSEDGVIGIGKLPASLPIEVLDASLGVPVNGAIDQARIGDSETLFSGAVKSALSAFALLETGSLVVDEAGQVSVSGLVDDPASMSAALAALSVVPGAKVDLSFVDDGEPFLLDLIKGPAGVSGTGKLPASLTAEQLQEQLGTPVSGPIQQSFLGSEADDFAGSAQAGLAALRLLNKGRLLVVEEGVSLVGLSANPLVSAQVAQALEQMPEGVSLDLTLEEQDDGLPFEFTAQKTAQGVTLSGKLPASLRAVDLGPGTASDLRVARIGSEEVGFAEGVLAGLKVLDLAVVGDLTIADERLVLAATLPSPAEQAQADAILSEAAYALSLDTTYTLLDDGQPISARVVFDAGQGLTALGKFPVSFGVGDASDSLGLAVKDQSDQTGTLDMGADEIGAALAALAPFLPDLQAADLRWAEDAPSLQAEALPGVDADLLQDALASAMGAGWTTDLRASQAPPADLGTTRVNAATGQEERAGAAGIWLPVVDLAPSPASCGSALDGLALGFLPEEARLDAKAHRSLNHLAAVGLVCTAAGLKIEIGGHMDASGDTDRDFALSQARADAVRAALLLRGLPPAALVAVGYGPSQPVALNATDEGRSANRRITITWTAEDG